MDFSAAYNLIPVRHQRCWVHLLCELHALRSIVLTAGPNVAIIRANR